MSLPLTIPQMKTALHNNLGKLHFYQYLFNEMRHKPKQNTRSKKNKVNYVLQSGCHSYLNVKSTVGFCLIIFTIDFL